MILKTNSFKDKFKDKSKDEILDEFYEEYIKHENLRKNFVVMKTLILPQVKK